MSQEVQTTPASEKDRPYRIPESAITDDVRAVIASKIGDQAVAYPAKVGGSYKGPVIHADDSFIVQAVGKDRNSAVVHQRSDLEMQGAQLRQRDRNHDLVDRNIQVHYRGTSAKAYPMNPASPAQSSDKPADERSAAPAKPDRMYREFVVATAAEYAQGVFKTAKQREAFVGHVTAMLDPNRQISPGTPAPSAEKPQAAAKGGLTPAPAPAKPPTPAEPAR